MLAYFVKRIFSTIPVMLVVAVVVFSLLYLGPGDPAAIIAGDQATIEQVNEIRVSMGLDRPFLVLFGDWLWNVVHFDLGKSTFSGEPVTNIILSRLEPTLSLMLLSLVVAVTVAVPLGVAAAWRSGTWIDRTAMSVGVLGFSIPAFVLGYILVYIFSLKLGWFPVQGYAPLSRGFWPWMSTLILPAAALSLAYIAMIARITRAAMLEVMHQDYMRMAKAKGVSTRALLFRHALKNASIPIVTAVGLGIVVLISGAVVTENVFAIPGIGRLLVDSILKRDYVIVQGIVLMLSVTYVMINLLLDLTYTFLDPRIRY